MSASGLNILWIPNFFPFPADNGGKVVISNRMIWAAKSHRIHLIVEADAIDEGDLNVARQYCASIVVVPTAIKRNRPYLFYHMLKDSLNVGRYINSELSARILDCIEQNNIDLINVDLPMPCANLLPIEDRIRDIPIVINQHNIEYLDVRSKLAVQGIGILYKIYALVESHQLQKWEKMLYGRLNIVGFTFVSDTDLDVFRKDYPQMNKALFMSPIGTSFPCDDGETVYSDTVKTIVFPASFDYPPNVHGAKWFVQEVYPKIKQRIQNVRVVLVGRNPKKEIMDLAQTDIIVTGTVKSIIPYMKRADLFVVPIFFGGGVKTKLIEMGCWSKTVVSTTMGCKGTVFQKEKDLLIADQSQKFADLCIDALAFPEKYKKMNEHIYKTTVQHYLWDNIGIQYAAFLENVSITGRQGEF